MFWIGSMRKDIFHPAVQSLLWPQDKIDALLSCGPETTALTVITKHVHWLPFMAGFLYSSGFEKMAFLGMD
jgi:hypothetical protein